MLGGIIGDLAATTWQSDKPSFYKSLVAPDTKFSNYGIFTMDIAKALVNNGLMDYSRYHQLFGFKSYSEQENLITIVACMVAWTTDDMNKAIDLTNKMCEHEKSGGYALNMLIPLIISLRNGMSKDQALNSMDKLFRETLLSWDKRSDDAIGVVARAWDAFYRWFDFTSVIHSAVKSPVYPNLTAVVAGLLAQAMYGCDYIMLKRKYCKEDYHYFTVPLPYDCSFIKQYDMSARHFYPKNRALTNVEYHTWTPCENPYEGQYFYKETLDRIRMAFDTDWDDRFGIYLDNGWYYIYRSHWLLTRFKIFNKDGRYWISDVQSSGEREVKDSLVGMICAIDSAQRPAYSDGHIFLQPNKLYF